MSFRFQPGLESFDERLAPASFSFAAQAAGIAVVNSGIVIPQPEAPTNPLPAPTPIPTPPTPPRTGGM